MSPRSQYQVLTLDSQAFNANSFDLDGGWLARLHQFAVGPTKLVMSEVVIREVVRQLADKIHQTKARFEAAAKDAVLYGLDADLPEGLKQLKGSPRALAERRMSGFLKATDAIVVPADLVPTSALLDAYFKPTPPFAGSGKKKAEFPDAIALMSLEAWAKEHDAAILAVSGDGDWTGFADKSPCIDVLPTIEDALTAIHAARAEEARQLVETRLKAIDEPDSPEFLAFLGDLEPEIGFVTVYPTIESAQPAEIDSGELRLLSFTLAGEAPDYDYEIVEIGPYTVAASITLRVKATVTAYVRFSAWDSIDREEIVLGGHEVEREADDLEATVIATWTLEGEDWRLEDVELLQIESPDLGLVEMDWGSDRDEDVLEDEASPSAAEL